MNDQRVLDISWETILKIAIAAVAFYILYLIRDILVWIVFALIISILFNPAIDYLRRFVPRVIATVLIYVIVFGIIGVSVFLIAPVFVSEIHQFSQFFPEYFEKISPPFRGLGIEAFQNLESFTETIEKSLTFASANIFNAIGAIFGGLLATITIFTIALFLSLEEKGIERVARVLAPSKYEAIISNLWQRSQKKVSGWFGARILCSAFVGAMTFIICYFLNIPYAVSFAFFAGIMDFIPIIGPITAGAIIAIIALADSWLKALFFVIAFLLIQQIEGVILTPALTKRFIGLPPVLVLISLMIGGKLWGIMGALLAIPIAGILFEFLRDFLQKKKEEESSAT